MLDAQEPAWAATLAENQDNHELGPVLSLLQGNLADIRKLRQQAQETLQLVVNLQIKVSTFDQISDDLISRLIQARTKLKGHILDRDSLPLWNVNARHEQGETSSVFRSVTGRWISIVAFLQENRGTILFLILLFIGSELAGVSPKADREGQAARRRNRGRHLPDTRPLVRRWAAASVNPGICTGTERARHGAGTRNPSFVFSDSDYSPALAEPAPCAWCSTFLPSSTLLTGRFRGSV